MCHIQRKTVSILSLPHVYLDLAPPCQKKSEIGYPPPPHRGITATEAEIEIVLWIQIEQSSYGLVVRL